MKRYLIILSVITAVLLVVAVVVKIASVPFFAPISVWLLPVAVFYFGIADSVQYWLTVRSVNKNPKTFVQFFLAVSVGVLFLHLLVLVGGIVSQYLASGNLSGGKRFAICFLVLYVIYTCYIIAELVRFVRQAGK